ncbi:MAG TPA: dihydrofolate reductase family protein [Ohtaekwangia sp.]|nr:dihydrofolate reductase family protein [Ohtaekwangia sp.]
MKRKIKLQIQMSVDGFIAGPDGNMEWMQWNWDDQLKGYVRQLTESMDCIILGRKLAEGFIPYWSSHPDDEGAENINKTRKVVFSKTLKKSPWETATIASGDLVDEITKLKNQSGKDIIVYGGANFVTNLIKHKLIDEFHFLVNPTLLGSGMSIFKAIPQSNLKLKKAMGFECGISVLNYELV